MTREEQGMHGWKRLMRERRASHRQSSAAMNLSQATWLASKEVRVRQALARHIGRTAAKEVKLLACMGPEGPGFILLSAVPNVDAAELARIPRLLRAVSSYP